MKVLKGICPKCGGLIAMSLVKVRPDDDEVAGLLLQGLTVRLEDAKDHDPGAKWCGIHTDCEGHAG